MPPEINSLRVRADVGGGGAAATLTLTVAAPDLPALANSQAPCARSRDTLYEWTDILRTEKWWLSAAFDRVPVAGTAHIG
ncbi:hypothetical protein B1T49_11220 [Mycobacterium persicum]|nr:hypothetical protein B1T43_17305 [Mycobacterium kansasii]ORB89696.1 hypothetical protein B1T49_11220 [Mycobacterium persicum]